ncbi:MAG: efflux RND transporter periplasmic adaptor subunit [bacterium]|nr:efflux RND transporter periplasmic adaptor subunit [bacterium]
MLHSRSLLLAAVAVPAVLCGGCTTVEAPPPPPPPSVVVAQPVQRDVTNYSEFPGNLQATQGVEIRARVEGFLERVEFEPSARVKTGQTLFVIEQEIFEATLERAKADVRSSRAALARAESDLERLEQAIKTNAVSQQEVTRARAEREQAAAAVAAAATAVTRAELDLEYTVVTSPINGVIDRNLVDIGNVVGRGETTLLANVYTIDPIHVYFNAPERKIAAFLDQQGGLDSGNAKQLPPVEVRVDGVDRVFEGAVDYLNPEVDPATGTVEVRAALPNANRQLLPGFFVRVRVPETEEPDANLVHETALSVDLAGRYLLIVGADNVVEKRYVDLGALQDDGLRVIREGIEAGESYISEGLQRARPGLPVTPSAGN